MVMVSLVSTHYFSCTRWWHFGHCSEDPGQGLGVGWELRYSSVYLEKDWCSTDKLEVSNADTGDSSRRGLEGKFRTGQNPAMLIRRSR